jgi:hypothetical protein
MSGGHFDYKQSSLYDIASQIDEIIASNDSTELNRYGQEIGYHFPPDIIAKFDETRKTLRFAAAMAQRVDWLLSGDDGEESFRSRWEDTVKSPYGILADLVNVIEAKNNGDHSGDIDISEAIKVLEINT